MLKTIQIFDAEAVRKGIRQMFTNPEPAYIDIDKTKAQVYLSSGYYFELHIINALDDILARCKLTYFSELACWAKTFTITADIQFILDTIKSAFEEVEAKSIKLPTEIPM
jgi:hypothetical protein